MSESREARIAYFRAQFDGFREDAAQGTVTKGRQEQFHQLVIFLSEECIPDEMYSSGDDGVIIRALTKDFGRGFCADLLKWSVYYGIPARTKAKIEVAA